MSHFPLRRLISLTVIVAALVGLALRRPPIVVQACFPCFQIGPITITPAGPAPTAVVHAADQAVNQAAPAVTHAVGGAVSAVANAAVAPQGHLLKVIAGQENLSDAAKGLVDSQGQQVQAVAEAVSTTNAATNNIKVVAAESIGGDFGKTVLTIGTGADRLQVEFATTAAIETGQLAQGNLRPEELAAEPLAAAIRSAEKQFESDAKPIPDDVKAALAPYYPADVLQAARWTVGSVSLSIPDLINQGRKVFANIDNAVTVGHVTVFVRDPESNYHWWAHELQHQVQYHNWGIDSFAYKYMTSCHDVESNAEDEAQKAVPISGTVSLGC